MRALDASSPPQCLDRLYRTVWALCGDRQDAEDLVQKMVARVLARPPTRTSELVLEETITPKSIAVQIARFAH